MSSTAKPWRWLDACLRLVVTCEPEWWALENPIGKLVQWLGKPRMYFQPWEYGDPYTKRTALWGRFTKPKKRPVFPAEGGKIWKMGPSPDRAAKRSITPAGFAQAFYEANSERESHATDSGAAPHVPARRTGAAA